MGVRENMHDAWFSQELAKLANYLARYPAPKEFQAEDFTDADELEADLKAQMHYLACKTGHKHNYSPNRHETVCGFILSGNFEDGIHTCKLPLTLCSINTWKGKRRNEK